MATIDYKEKYEQALERARQFSEKPYLEDSAGIVEYIFPELKESEDERIRKGLIEYFLHYPDHDITYYDLKSDSVISWLEKQGEQPKDVTYTHEVKTGNGNIKALVTEKVQLPKKFEKQGEQKHNSVLDIEIPFGAKDSELQEASYYIPEGFHAEIEGNRVVIKRGEQKPAEWSEEDERKRRFIENELSCLIADEKELESLLSFRLKDLYSALYWIKSLRPQNRWKPSDEQMKQLGWVAEQNKDNMIGKELMTLYNDLKKL